MDDSGYLEMHILGENKANMKRSFNQFNYLEHLTTKYIYFFKLPNF